MPNASSAVSRIWSVFACRPKVKSNPSVLFAQNLIMLKVSAFPITSQVIKQSLNLKPMPSLRRHPPCLLCKTTTARNYIKLHCRSCYQKQQNLNKPKLVKNLKLCLKCSLPVLAIGLCRNHYYLDPKLRLELSRKRLGLPLKTVSPSPVPEQPKS